MRSSVSAWRSSSSGRIAAALATISRGVSSGSGTSKVLDAVDASCMLTSRLALDRSTVLFA